MLVVQLEDLLRRPAGEGLGEALPRRVANLVPEAQKRAEVGWRTGGEKLRCLWPLQ